MNFLSPCLLAISSNLDTLSVATSYGLKKINMTKSSVLLISIITSLGTFFSMYIGEFISRLFNLEIANIFGSVLLVFIGFYFLIEYIKAVKKNRGEDISYYVENSQKYNDVLENPTIVDKDASGEIDIKESLILSFALTINNLSVGIASSITGVSISLSVFFNFIITILSIYLGHYLGNTYLSKLFGKYSNLISGVLLIILGIYELFIWSTFILLLYNQ